MTDRPPPVAPPRSDPMEALIEQALVAAEIDYRADFETEYGLDFYLPDQATYLEVKRFHSDRIGEQMSRVDNVIVAQGEGAVRLLSQLLRNYQPEDEAK